VKFLYEMAELPEDLKKCPVEFFSTPQKVTTEGMMRPAIEDTLAALQSSRKLIGPILFISSQPYCQYQASVIRAVFSRDLAFEVVGLQCSENEKVSALLEIIAKELETEYRNKK